MSERMPSRPSSRPSYPLYLYEVVAYIDRGWWVVDAPGVGERTRVATLSDVDSAARTLISRSVHLSRHAFDVDIRVLRSTPTALIRSRWFGSSAPLFLASHPSASPSESRSTTEDDDGQAGVSEYVI